MAFSHASNFSHASYYSPQYRDYAVPSAISPDYLGNGHQQNGYTESQTHELLWNAAPSIGHYQNSYISQHSGSPEMLPNFQQPLSHQSYPQQSYEQHYYPPSAPYGCHLQLDDPADQNVEVQLENKELWQRFNQHGTEMIITKAGR